MRPAFRVRPTIDDYRDLLFTGLVYSTVGSYLLGSAELVPGSIPLEPGRNEAGI